MNEAMLTVTGIRPMSNKSKRKAARVLQREDFDTTLPTTSESRQDVAQMRSEIEEKEVELNHLRELLARKDETDISGAQSELNRLQTAFDNVVRQCEDLIRPIEEEYNKETSTLQGKNQFCEAIKSQAKERSEYLKKLDERTLLTVTQLDNPEVPNVSEKKIIPVGRQSAQILAENGVLKRLNALETHTQNEMNKLNEVLKRKLKEFNEGEKMAQMNFNSAKQDIDVRAKAPKIQIIDDDWIEAKADLDYNQIMISQLNKQLTEIQEECRKVENKNREAVEEMRKLREELIILNRYIPGEDQTEGKTTRADLTKEQIEIDVGRVHIECLKTKVKTESKRLKPITEKLNELPPLIAKQQRELEEARAARQKAEEELLDAHQKRSVLISEKYFAEDQFATMCDRTDQLRKRLREIAEETEMAEKELKKQEVIMKLNEEMNQLKTKDFNGFTTTLSKILEVQKEISD